MACEWRQREWRPKGQIERELRMQWRALRRTSYWRGVAEATIVRPGIADLLRLAWGEKSGRNKSNGRDLENVACVRMCNVESPGVWRLMGS